MVIKMSKAFEDCQRIMKYGSKEEIMELYKGLVKEKERRMKIGVWKDD
jgi:hypothetical protein